MKRRKILYLLALLLLVLLLLCGYKSSHLIYNVCISVSDFSTRDNKIYFSPQINTDERDSLQVMVDSAFQRNRSFWGSRDINYQLVFCKTDDELRKYAQGAKSVSFATYTGVYIVISEDITCIDIMSHELCHAFLYNSIGYQNKKRLPAWFDEGTAMQLDYRPLFTNSSYTTDQDQLEKISTFKAFNNADWKILKYNYIVSKYEVEGWIKKYGKYRFNKFIESLAKGRKFKEVYEKTN